MSEVAGAESDDTMLARFFASSPAAQLAIGCLREGAEAAITFAALAGDWRFAVSGDGGYVFEAAVAKDPDFELQLSHAAVVALCAHADGDIGDLGVDFFEHIVSRDPERKVHVKVQSGVMKLTRRGWLRLMTHGGSKVGGWMLTKGLRGPGAVATALGRLRA